MKQVAKGFLDTFWSLLMTFIILFGIIGGIFTPTEASVIAIIYALIIGRFVYKKLNFKNIMVIVLDSMKTSASLMVLIGFANLEGAPKHLFVVTVLARFLLWLESDVVPADQIHPLD